MADHEMLGSHATYGPVMKGPKGGLYVIYNGKKYYGAEYGEGPKFTKAAGVTDAMVKAAAQKTPDVVASKAAKGLKPETKASAAPAAKAAPASPPAAAKGVYKSFAENKAANPSWTEADQVKHASETEGGRMKLAQEKHDYHMAKLAEAKKSGNSFEESWHEKKLDALAKTKEGKELAAAAKKKAAEESKAKKNAMTAPKAASPLKMSDQQAGQEVAAITKNLPKRDVMKEFGAGKDGMLRSAQDMSRLSDDQRISIRQFTGSFSSEIRQAAQGKGELNKYKRHADQIDAAMKAHAKPMDGVTFRGMSLSSSQLHQLLTHDVFFNTGPTSTSWSPETAKNFAGSPTALANLKKKGMSPSAFDGNPKSHSVILVHKNPRGLAVESHSQHPGEREVVLPHNQKYRVTSRAITPDGYHVIEVEDHE